MAVTGVEVWRVSGPEAGQKLLRFLRRRFHGTIPNSALQRWIRTGQVRVDGARAKPDTRLKKDQLIRIPPHTLVESPSPRVEGPATGQLNVVHEQPGFLVLAKPGGLPVHPGTGHTDSITTRLHHRFAADAWMPTPVHRLDRDTSGLLVVAKTYAGLRDLHELWRSHRVRKAYLAWAVGTTLWSTPTCIEDLARKEHTNFGEKVLVGAGKPCLSLVRTIVRTGTASLVLIAPITGRTHQIRVQMASRGHPLIGDKKYGGPDGPKENMLLHAWLVRWPGQEFCLLPSWQPPWNLQQHVSKSRLLQMTQELLAQEQARGCSA